MKKLTPTKIGNIFTLLGIIISLFAIKFSQQAITESKTANNIANSANTIAVESKNISQQGLDFQKENRSYDISSRSYSDIYDKSEIRMIINQIKSNKKVGSRDSLLKVVDVLEGLGNDYCQGNAWKLHINTIMGNTLNYSCNNTEVFTNFGYKKNGLSMLCFEFYPDSVFATTINMQNIESCKFYDSARFAKE